MEAWLAAVTFALGLVLRPLVDRLIRRQQQHESWQERLEELSADLSSFLWRGLTENQPKQAHDAAFSEWMGGLQRQVVLAARFAPEESHRDACDAVWVEFEKLIRRMHALDRTPDDSPRRAINLERYQQAYGETSYALDGLVETLGGPKRLARSEYTIPLRDEGDPGLEDLS